MRRLLLLVILASCSKDTVGEPAAPAPARPVDAPAASRPQPVPAPPAGPAWRWIARKSDPEFMKTPDVAVRAGETYRFVTNTPAGEQQAFVERVDDGGKVVWARELESQFVDAAAMAHGDERLYVAHHSHIATGCRLLALDTATGDVVWHSDLVGLGPVSHSKYRNRVQLRVDGDRITVYGWESAGRYIEVVDAATGKTLVNHRPSEALAELAWQWETPERTAFHAGPTSISARGGGSYGYEPREHPDPAELARTGAGGAERWRVKLDAEGGCGNAAMLEQGDALYAVHYCSIASGARLYVLDAATGAIRQQRALEGLGPIGHSEYFNDVEIRALHGHVVVFGNEAVGRYIEALDPSTGALVSSQVFLDW